MGYIKESTEMTKWGGFSYTTTKDDQLHEDISKMGYVTVTRRDHLNEWSEVRSIKEVGLIKVVVNHAYRNHDNYVSVYVWKQSGWEKLHEETTRTRMLNTYEVKLPKNPNEEDGANDAIREAYEDITSQMFLLAHKWLSPRREMR